MLKATQVRERLQCRIVTQRTLLEIPTRVRASLCDTEHLGASSRVIRESSGLIARLVSPDAFLTALSGSGSVGTQNGTIP